MALKELVIPGINGDVSTTYSFWKGYRFTVNGVPLKPHGFPRNNLTLPGEGGPIAAKIKGGLFRAYPSLVVAGTEYPTGPATPRGLQIVALLPILGLVIAQGGLGFLIAFGGIAINMGIIRGGQSARVKVAAMLMTLVAVVALDVALVVAIHNAFGR